MNVKAKIVMIGSGGHALSCLDVINASHEYTCAGYVDIKESSDAQWKTVPYLGDDSSYPKLIKEFQFFCLGVGQIESPNSRERIAKLVLQAGGKFPVIIAPTAYVSATARLAEGTVVMHGSHVGPAAMIGRFNILNTKSLLEHGVKTADFVHVSTGAVVNGDVQVGEGSFIGSNAVVRQSLIVPSRTFVQAGKFFSNSSLDQA